MKRLVLTAMAALAIGCSAGKPGNPEQPEQGSDAGEELPLVPVEDLQPPARPAAIARGTVRMMPAQATRVGEIRAVVLTFDTEHVYGDAHLALEFRAPDGTPFGRQVRELQAAGGEPRQLLFTLPVAGTLVQQNGLVGSWSAHLMLEGRDLASVGFELQP